MTNEIAIQAKTDLVIAPDQTEFTDVQLAALRQLGVEDAPPGDLQVFFHQAKRTGLDPFARQIYMIGRRTKVGNSYETRYTIQIGIDGYRLNARRAADRNGDELTVDGPYWAGDDGVWRDLWVDASKPPAAAKFTVFRNREAFTGVAMYHEYVQTYWNNDEKAHVPNSMWAKMPANQLAKCFSADTEVLTINGYRRFDQVGPHDLIMQVTDNGLSPVAATPFVQRYDGPMIAVHGDMLDFCVTPNHDMVTDYGKIEAGALHALATAKTAVRIPLTAPGRTDDHPGVSDDDLRLLGYVIADGCESRAAYTVAVSRRYKIDQLQRLNPTSITVQRTKGQEAVATARTIRTNFDKLVYRFNATRLAAWLLPGKQINTTQLANLSQRQARIVIDAWQEFDGHTDQRSRVRRLFTSREDHVAAAELLATAAGYSVNTPRKRVSDISERPGYILTISEPQPVPVVRRAGSARPQIMIEPTNSSGEVWCVTVPSGRIMVRRNGFGMVCGNCAEAAAYRRAYPDDFSGLVLEDAAQVIDPNGEPVKVMSTRPGGRGVDSLRARAEAAKNEGGTPNGAADDSIPALFAAAEVTEVADQFIVASAILGREVVNTDGLSDDDITRIHAQLIDWREAGQLDDKVRDALNEHDIKAEQAAGNSK